MLVLEESMRRVSCLQSTSDSKSVLRTAGIGKYALASRLYGFSKSCRLDRHEAERDNRPPDLSCWL
jgi:hypothetical protein